MLSDGITAVWSFWRRDVRWRTEIQPSPTCLNTEKDIKPPTCQETSLKCAHASDALCNRSNCCAVCVVPVPVLSSSPSLFSLPHSCSARVLRSHSAPTLPLAGFQNQTTQTVKRISYQKQFDIHLWCLGNLHTTFSPLLPAWDSMSATGMHSLIGSASAWLQTHVGWWLTGSNLRLSYFPSCLRASEPAVYFFNVAFVTLLTVSVTPAWQLF